MIKLVNQLIPTLSALCIDRVKQQDRCRKIACWPTKCYGELGGPIRTEHENWPYFSTELWKSIHILTDFRNRNTGGLGNSLFGQISIAYFEIIGREIGNRTPLEPPSIGTSRYIGCKERSIGQTINHQSLVNLISISNWSLHHLAAARPLLVQYLTSLCCYLNFLSAYN